MANYKPFKMKGHALPGINQREGHPKVAAEGLAASSPAQWDWKNTLKKGWDKATQIGMGLSRMLPDRESVGGSTHMPTPIANFKEAYQAEKVYDEERGGGLATYKKGKKRTKSKSSTLSQDFNAKYKKSPAKCPLIAAIPAIAGAVGSLTKKKEQ